MGRAAISSARLTEACRSDAKVLVPVVLVCGAIEAGRQGVLLRLVLMVNLLAKTKLGRSQERSAQIVPSFSLALAITIAAASGPLPAWSWLAPGRRWRTAAGSAPGPGSMHRRRRWRP
jgi:hypothetical protein